MNITFLIGNGFDLNLGLKTSYKDFYKYYINKAPNDLIAKSIKKDYKLWSDLELGLGNFSEKLDDLQVLEFLDSKALLEKHLSDYLKKENSKFSISKGNEFIKEFVNKIALLYNDLNMKEKKVYKRFLNSANAPLTYSFISFNYTNTLDRMIELCKNTKKFFSTHISNHASVNDTIQSPLHIHGTINSELILGLDDVSQIKKSIWHKDEELMTYLVKPILNEELGQLKIEQGKQMIDDSRYICIYGMSIGDTDNTWWRYIIDWLIKDKQNRLILYVYDSSIVQVSGQEKLRLANKNRNKFLQKNTKLKDEIKKQIINQISFIQNSEIFNFKNIEIKEDEDGQAEDAE